MILRLLVPYVDRLITGGTIAHWHTAEGDLIDYGDDVFDLSAPVRGVTLVRVTASDSGYLRRLVAAGGTQKNEGELVAVVTTDPDEAIDEAALAEASTFRVVASILSPGDRACV